MNKLFIKLALYRPSTYIDSIKLSGAIVNAILTLYGDKYLEPIKNYKLLVSDLMKYENEPLFYLTKIPKKPNINLSRENKIEIMKQRKRKKDYFNVQELYEMVLELSNNGILVSSQTEKDTDIFEYYNSFQSEIGVNINEQKVFTKNYNSKGAIHYNNGLSGDYNWFLILYDNDFSKKQIIAALNYLSDVGISGRQSTGKGLFNYNIDESDVFKNLTFEYTGEGYYYLSSAFIPESDYIKSIDFKKSFYSLDIFSGRDHDGKILGVYRYLKRGSLLYLKENIRGRIIPVSDNRLLFFTGPIMRGFLHETKLAD